MILVPLFDLACPEAGAATNETREIGLALPATSLDRRLGMNLYDNLTNLTNPTVDGRPRGG